MTSVALKGPADPPGIIQDQPGLLRLPQAEPALPVAAGRPGDEPQTRPAPPQAPAACEPEAYTEQGQ